MKYIKAEVYSRQTLLAQALSLNIQDDTLILKELSTDQLVLHDPVDITIFTDQGIQHLSATTAFIVDGVQANFMIKQGSSIIERRESLKVRTSIPNHLTQVNISSTENRHFEEPLEIQIVNISLGGMMFTATEKLDVGNTSSFTFQNGSAPVMLRFEIVRVEEQEDGVYCYGCKFAPLSNNADSTLCNYIYQIQLMERRKAREE